MSPTPAVLVGVPVRPDADEARRWAQEELAKAAYSDSPGLVERFLDWLGRILGRVGELDTLTPPELVPVLLVVGLVVVLVLARVLGGRVRRGRARDVATGTALFEDDRSSADLHAAADAAARRGDHVAAVLDRFRAIIRGLDERGALDDRAGLTAHEAAALAAGALPGLTGPLGWAGRLFDDVRYGHASAGPAEDEAMRSLAARVSAAHPRVTTGAGAAPHSTGTGTGTRSGPAAP
ncbi:DUF4129 domain-containing protein [Georgenia muralis]